jgi:hypothetical protein
VRRPCHSLQRDREMASLQCGSKNDASALTSPKSSAIPSGCISKISKYQPLCHCKSHGLDLQTSVQGHEGRRGRESTKVVMN